MEFLVIVVKNIEIVIVIVVGGGGGGGALGNGSWKLGRKGGSISDGCSGRDLGIRSRHLSTLHVLLGRLLILLAFFPLFAVSFVLAFTFRLAFAYRVAAISLLVSRSLPASLRIGKKNSLSPSC
jgi:hypothetical protein